LDTAVIIMASTVQRDDSPDDSVRSIRSRAYGSTNRRGSVMISLAAKRVTVGRQTRIGGGAGRGSIMVGGQGALLNKERRTEGRTYITACQIWRMPRPGINSEEVLTKGQNRVLYTNNTTANDIYCPACDLFFDDLDHYHLHIAQREMERVVERATERVNESISKNDAEISRDIGITLGQKQPREEMRQSSMRFRQSQNKRDIRPIIAKRNKFTLGENRKTFDFEKSVKKLVVQKIRLTYLSNQLYNQESVKTARRKSIFPKLDSTGKRITSFMSSTTVREQIRGPRQTALPAI